MFKVRADFHDDVTRTSEHELALVAKMADIIDYANLYPFDSSAQTALLEHLSLQAEDQDRLSLHSDRLIKLLHESIVMPVSIIKISSMPTMSPKPLPIWMSVQATYATCTGTSSKRPAAHQHSRSSGRSSQCFDCGQLCG